MAHIRHDFGSVRWVYEGLCKDLGHAEVAEITGKSIWTVRSYCNPGNRRNVPLADMKALDKHLWLKLKREPVFYEAIAKGIPDSVGAAAVVRMRAVG